MPARVVDGDSLYLSKKVKRLNKEHRAEYSYLIPLAEANGVFDADPDRIWAVAYAYLRDGIDPGWVRELLADFEKQDLLRTWGEGGKTWGYWTGIGKTGRLPSKEHLKRYKNLPPNPPSWVLAEELVPESSRIIPDCTGLGIGIGIGDGIGSGMVREPAALENFEIPLNGQEEEMKLKDELTKISAKYGAKAGGYKSTWDDIKRLGIAYGTGAVAQDFEKYMEFYQGDDFPNGSVSKYANVAEDRLRNDSQAMVSVKDPEVNGLARELSYLSGGVISFVDKQKIRLGEVLKEFTAEEISTCFKDWLTDQDLNDAKNVQFLPGKFAQIADSRAYTLRRTRQEHEKDRKARDETSERLQREAEQERADLEKKKQEEEELFDPLA